MLLVLVVPGLGPCSRPRSLSLPLEAFVVVVVVGGAVVVVVLGVLPAVLFVVFVVVSGGLIVVVVVSGSPIVARFPFPFSGLPCFLLLHAALGIFDRAVDEFLPCFQEVVHGISVPRRSVRVGAALWIWIILACPPRMLREEGSIIARRPRRRPSGEKGVVEWARSIKSIGSVWLTSGTCV